MANTKLTEGKGILGANLGNDTLKMALLTADYTPSAGDALATILANEISNTAAPSYDSALCVGYSAGGVALGNQAWAAASGNFKLSSDDAHWGGNATITARYALLYDDTASKAIGVLDPGSLQVCTLSDFTIHCPANGWLRNV